MSCSRTQHSEYAGGEARTSYTLRSPVNEPLCSLEHRLNSPTAKNHENNVSLDDDPLKLNERPHHCRLDDSISNLMVAGGCVCLVLNDASILVGH